MLYGQVDRHWQTSIYIVLPSWLDLDGFGWKAGYDWFAWISTELTWVGFFFIEVSYRRSVTCPSSWTSEPLLGCKPLRQPNGPLKAALRRGVITWVTQLIPTSDLISFNIHRSGVWTHPKGAPCCGGRPLEPVRYKKILSSRQVEWGERANAITLFLSSWFVIPISILISCSTMVFS